MGGTTIFTLFQLSSIWITNNEVLELAGKNGYRTTSELKASLECDYLNYRVITTSAGTHADGRAGLPSQPLQQTTVFQLSSLTSPLRLQLRRPENSSPESRNVEGSTAGCRKERESSYWLVNKTWTRNYLTVQWLEPSAFTAEVQVLPLVIRELRSHKPYSTNGEKKKFWTILLKKK